MTLELVSLQVRLYLLKKHVDLSIPYFYLDIIKGVVFPALCIAVVLFSVRYLELNSFLQIFTTFGLTILVYPALIYFISLESKQKRILLELFSKIKWLKIK
jgi:ABC-type transport system involved in cytochrome bd biosynthesis fused ATPase/permease subunit